jgi:branched-chain amino acid transport system substrate-binding protein
MEYCSILRLCVTGLFVGGLTDASIAETKGPVTDSLGVVIVQKGAPLLIGGYWALSGAEISLGLDQQRGVELAFDNHDNQFLGHPLRLVSEDSQCSAEGGQTAATRLAANRDLVVVLGPDCSSSATAASPVLWKAGLVSIGTSASAPALTAPDRADGLKGYMRTVFNDLDQGAADARYIFNELKCRTMATIHDGSPYAQQLVTVAGENFKKLGGEVVATEAVTPTDVEVRPMLTDVATKKPCVIYFPIFTATGAQVVRQLREIVGLDKTIPFAGSAMAAPGFLEAAGEAAVGLRFGKVDSSPESRGSGYPALLAKYKAKYGETPSEVFHANAYDAAQIALAAIKKVAQQDGDGNTYIGRQALKDALFATSGYQGMSGTITCNPNGDCAEFKAAVYQWVSADPSTFEIGKNPKQIYPAN